LLPILAAAAWLMLALSSVTSSLIFAAYAVSIAAAARGNLAYVVSSAAICFSLLSILSKLYSVDLIYAAIASAAVLLRGAVNERSSAFNYALTAAAAAALMPYMQAVLLSTYA